MQFTVHEEPITSCRFIDDGKLIATSSCDKTIGISDISSGSKVHQLCGHNHQVVSLSVHQSGQALASVSWDKNLILWDLNTQDHLLKVEHESLLTCCHTTPDQPLIVVGCDDGSYHYWDPRTTTRVASVNAHSNTITDCYLSPSGIDLCTCSMDKTAIIWDIRSYKQLLKLSDHRNVVSGCAFSHNGHFLATCSWDKMVCVYDISSGGYRIDGPVALSAHVGSVSACSFSADGTLLVSCGYDQGINVWKTKDFQLRSTFLGHDGWIEDIDIDEQSKHIVSCGKDGKICIWHTAAKSNRLCKNKKKNFSGISLAHCSQCGRKFSPAGVSESTSKHSTISGKPTIGTNSEDGNKEGITQLCVFCRLKDPSRTLDQRSDHYLSVTHT